jgi:hypothetical protein
MSAMVGDLHYRKLRAPKEDGETLIDPPAARVSELLERNLAIFHSSDIDLQGRSISLLRRDGRAQLVEAALSATRQYRDVNSPALESPAAPILLAGHQPELFHPGVWYKNFVLNRLALEHRAIAINLVIDSDVAKAPSIRVPTGAVENPQLESVAFDQSTVEVPFEERSIIDQSCWDSFGVRVLSLVRPLVTEPLVRQFWPLAIERSRATSRLSDCLAQARHRQEALWGSQSLELPQSAVCQLESFHWFSAHLLAHLPRLWEIYNESVAKYRRVNYVRSSAHPVPDLTADERWLEAPFWIWSSNSPKRRRLFVQQSGEELLLSDRSRIHVRLPLSADRDAQAAVNHLASLSRRGIKLRTRALITTMFARVVLGDLFVHGIGGSKYDQLTDLLIERFLGLEPPAYLTATATLRLPVRLPQETDEDLHRVDAELRNLTYHPESFLNGAALSADAAAALQTKRDWIGVQQTPENAKTRCRSIRNANDALQSNVAARRGELLERRERLIEALRKKEMLGSREFPFVLYPGDRLQSLFADPEH